MHEYNDYEKEVNEIYETPDKPRFRGEHTQIEHVIRLSNGNFATLVEYPGKRGDTFDTISFPRLELLLSDKNDRDEEFGLIDSYTPVITLDNDGTTTYSNQAYKLIAKTEGFEYLDE